MCLRPQRARPHDEHGYLHGQLRHDLLPVPNSRYFRREVGSSIGPGMLILAAAIVVLLLMSLRNRRKTPESKLE